MSGTAPDSPDTSPIFRPLSIRSLELKNRLVMSPMTRSHSPNGVPGADVADYYRKRAEGGTGLLITEGVTIDHPAAVENPSVPHMFGDEALAGWRRVTDDVHAAGGKIIPQLWHVGPLWGAMGRPDPAIKPMRPSGLWGTPGVTSYPEKLVARYSPATEPMTAQDIDDVLSAYVRSARNAVDAGFDGIAIHGGHGYLLDAFMWADTNRRTDEWGGSLAARAAFPAAVVAAIRAEIGDELPIFYRFSQHKQQDYKARIADTPEELKVLLGTLVDAGADVLDASIRRFDAPVFDGDPCSLAGWAKRLTGARTMAVGSFGLGKTLREGRSAGTIPSEDNREELHRRLTDEEFDLIAVGRLHLADPDLAQHLYEGGPLPEFDRDKHERVLH
ncbi:oxidoreductase [Tomitella cavernea]|uniref:oxidoreductase n=1 Tax=Tomitella cavernea TaxID=1387982 RepID=UPI001905799A|nr:12-oxophytodienoate reductase [Tomitella cavernea]